MSERFVDHYNASWFGEKHPVVDPLVGYQAPPLDGIWATAPYLHNGSVPTIYDLLLPARQRPSVFRLGSREYDPVKLGYREDGPRAPQSRDFLFETRYNGNWNSGHEWKKAAIIGVARRRRRDPRRRRSAS